MNTLKYIILSQVLLCSLGLNAETSSKYKSGGMWMPHQMKMERIQQDLKILKVDTKIFNLSDLLAYPLGAVVQIGRFCSGAFVSQDGLISTNHHCIRALLKTISNEKNDYVRNGFVAKSKSQEASLKDQLIVYVTESMEDVTAEFLHANSVIDKTGEIIQRCEQEMGKKYNCTVKSFYSGGEYYLVKSLQLKDVRMVFAPPDSVAMFGGMSENFKWPRNAADFAFIRAYANEENDPSVQSEKNSPYKPRFYLKAASEFPHENEFAMILGYPGSTNRYETYYRILFNYQSLLPITMKIHESLIAFYKKISAQSEEAKRLYVNNIFSLQNSLDVMKGQYVGLKNGNLAIKKEQEDRFVNWLNSQSAENFVETITNLQKQNPVLTNKLQMLNILSIASSFNIIFDVLYTSVESEKEDAKREARYQEKSRANIMTNIQNDLANYNPKNEIEILKLIVKQYYDAKFTFDIPELDSLVQMANDESALQIKIEQMVNNTELTKIEKIKELFGKPLDKVLSKDDSYAMLIAAIVPVVKNIRNGAAIVQNKLNAVLPAYMKKLAEYKNQDMYPDANGTLRVAYGVIKSEVNDNVWRTTGKDLIERGRKKLFIGDFELEEKVLFGMHENKDLVNNFLTNLDMTGGNSGSATLNRKGEWIGQIYDGNQDAIPSNNIYSTSARSVHVDLRYIFYVTRLYGASWIVDEIQQSNSHKLKTK